MEEKEKKQNVIGKFINEHPVISFMTLFLVLDFAKDMTEIFVNKNQQTK
jgi:hypothetical protein